MLVSKLRSDGVFEGLVEVDDSTTSLSQGYSFSVPPQIPEGSHAVLAGTWRIVEGPAPQLFVAPQPAPYEDTVNHIVKETQAYLDAFAQTRGYDGILSLVSYISSTSPKFASEAQYGLESRDATWQKVYEIIEQIKVGTRPRQTRFIDIVAELPPLQWPTDVQV